MTPFLPEEKPPHARQGKELSVPLAKCGRKTRRIPVGRKSGRVRRPHYNGGEQELTNEAGRVPGLGDLEPAQCWAVASQEKTCRSEEWLGQETPPLRGHTVPALSLHRSRGVTGLSPLLRCPLPRPQRGSAGRWVTPQERCHQETLLLGCSRCEQIVPKLFITTFTLMPHGLELCIFSNLSITSLAIPGTTCSMFSSE